MEAILMLTPSTGEVSCSLIIYDMFSSLTLFFPETQTSSLPNKERKTQIPQNRAPADFHHSTFAV